MRIIKERCNNIFIIRTDTYAKSILHIHNLVAIAKEYFPDLEEGDIEVIRYAGERYAKTYGIEFPHALTGRYLDFDPVSQLENY